MLNGNASWPAGTGVWVVKTVERCTAVQRVVERAALLDVLADALQGHERGMALVQVPHGGLTPSACSARTPPMPRMISCWIRDLAVAAVEPGGELAIPRRVLLEIRVEQEQPHAPESHAPDGGEHRAIAERDRGHARRPSGVSAASMGASVHDSRS